MRVKKIVSIIFCILSLLVIVRMRMVYLDIEKADKYIKQQLIKPTKIVFEINGKDNSLSNVGFYPRKAEYLGIFNRLSKGYEEVADNPRVVDSEISYYIINVSIHNEYFRVVGCDDVKKEMFRDGDSFSEEDITVGKNAVIIPVGMKNSEGKEIKIGDEITIESIDNLHVYVVDCTVVGFHNIGDNVVYMPNKAIEKMSKKWISFENSSRYNSNTYSALPAGISNPTFSCMNERDYAYLVELIDGFMESMNIKYEIIRLEGNKEELPNIGQMEKEAIYCWYILAIIAIVYFILIRALHTNEIKQEEKFEKSLIEQQERYVSNLIATNQETHRLKHDMKHLFNHLYYMVENNEKDEALKMIQEVQQDIYQVEMPVFTNNKSFNLVMNMYKERAKEEGIDFNYSGVTNVKLNLQERKFFILLSNALDNAFVHNNQNKKVRIKIDDVNGYYRIMILNSTNLYRLDDDKKPFAGHGYGLKSMRQIVKEVQGDLDIHVENGWFTCVILLPKS